MSRRIHGNESYHPRELGGLCVIRPTRMSSCPDAVVLSSSMCWWIMMEMEDGF